VYKYLLLYSSQVRWESGGKYWTKVCNQYLIGLLLHHLFLLVHFSFRKSTAACILIVPAILSVPVFMYFIHKTFHSRTAALPQTQEEEDQVEALLSELRSEQQSMLLANNPHVVPAGPEQIEIKEAELLPVREVIRATSSGQAQDSIAQLESAEERIKAAHGGDFSPEMTALVTTNPYVNPVLFKKLYSLLIDPLLFPCLKRLEEVEERLGNARQ
jgi:hypothetical protein